MIRLLVQLDPKLWMQRTYLISSGDALSEAKALELERYYSIGLVSLFCSEIALRLRQMNSLRLCMSLVHDEFINLSTLRPSLL